MRGRPCAGKAYAETIIVVLLFLAAFAGAWSYLAWSGMTPGPEHGDSLNMIVSAMLWSTGHEFTEVPLMPLSFLFPQEFMDFLSQRADTLAPDIIPHHLFLPIGGERKFVYDRVYLLYCIGLLWRLFGISWSSLNILVGLIAGLTTVIAYGIFRLGMRRSLAILGTAAFVTSPLFLTTLPALRDLAKAPFILGAIFAVCCLIGRAPGKRTLLLLSAGIGLLLGVGMGFRPDILITPLPVMASLLFAPGVIRLSFRFRLGALALFSCCFLVPALPVFRMMSETGGNNSFYLIQGFNRELLSNADTRRASYGPLCSHDDFLIHAAITNHDLRTNTAFRNERVLLRTISRRLSLVLLPHNLPMAAFARIAGGFCATDLELWSNESESAGRGLANDLIKTFPGDVVTRWIGATTRCLSGLQDDARLFDMNNRVIRASFEAHQILAKHIRACGLVYAFLVFLILASRGAWLGICAAMIPLYFCGYASLEFQLRHVFHMDFAAYWVLGFLLNQIFSLSGKTALFRSRFAAGDIALPKPAALLRAGLNMVIAILAIACFLGFPLITARAIQTGQVKQIVRQYESATLEPIAFSRQEMPNGRILCTPAQLPGFTRTPFSPNILSEYLVLEFDCPMPDCLFAVVYEPDYGRAAMAAQQPFLYHEDTAPQWGVPEPGTIRYFFPVYSFSKEFQNAYSAGYTLPEFSGLEVPQEVSVRNMYRVLNRKDFPTLMNVWLPSHTELFKGHCTLSPPLPKWLTEILS